MAAKILMFARKIFGNQFNDAVIESLRYFLLSWIIKDSFISIVVICTIFWYGHGHG